MRVNVDKVLERDQKLSELDDRADALQAGASQFESCAAKLKNKYWWKNCKVGTLARPIKGAGPQPELPMNLVVMKRMFPLRRGLPASAPLLFPLRA